jgi:hypothetical protein
MIIELTADDISQAIGEYLYNSNKLPQGYESATVDFEAKDGKFIIKIKPDSPSLQSVQ